MLLVSQHRRRWSRNVVLFGLGMESFVLGGLLFFKLKSMGSAEGGSR